MKKISIGILAHVDSGKTTLSESLLYITGRIKKQGRVDHGDTALDTNKIEKDRGITIFSKQAVATYGNTQFYFIDTPGHVDFGAEAERTLQILDCRILIVSSLDGIQNHTVTLWKLLQDYNIPTFIFVNKMDLPGADKNFVIGDIRKNFGSDCIDCSSGLPFEEIASCDIKTIEEYLETGFLKDESVTNLIFARKLFPCFFGSALKNEGVEEFIKFIEKHTPNITYKENFGGKVYKIAYDRQGNRLTFLKITGGSLTVKESVTYDDRNGEKHTDKINGIRIYTGEKFDSRQKINAGDVCAVTGLTATYRGQGLGFEKNNDTRALQAIFSYKVIFDQNKHDVRNVLMNLRKLEEEEPQLHVLWNEETKSININLMGKIQLEVIKSLFYQRFGTEISFDAGSVLYKETIKNTVEGVGHFEPLRHYAEVHLLMEPGEPNSGIQTETLCSEDKLDKNWQRLIITHITEKAHLGVLTGSPITDIKITLVNGRAHQKHTEGGDFRQATYRAIRNGLMQAENVLLEPWYSFEITVPTELSGRVMTDVTKMGGEFSSPVTEGENAVISGKAPVSEMNSYNYRLTDFSRGKGKISLRFNGYRPCHNREKVIEEKGYNPENDVDNPRDSIFCSHGAGHVVKWYDVPQNMHLESFLKPKKEETEETFTAPTQTRVRGYLRSLEDDKDLLRIFEMTYGKIKKEDKKPQKPRAKVFTSDVKDNDFTQNKKTPVNEKEYLLVDGYNIIFAWDELSQVAKTNFEAARNILADRLCNYRGFKKCELILVFDAYKVKGNPGEVTQYHNITVVYTKEAETADMYIEKVTKEIGKKHNVRVATSDGLEQIIILGNGALRLSARAFHEEVESIEKAIRDFIN